MFNWFQNKKEKERDLPNIQLIDSLARIVKKNGLNIEKLNVAFRFNDNQEFSPRGRHEVFLFSDKKESDFWHVPSLRDLFRGTKEPPQHEKEMYDPPYCQYLYMIEKNVLMINDFIHDITDDEFVRVYNLMRRRPDGRSAGPIHDVIWQTTALVLGMYEISQMEYEAVFHRLTASARGWKTAAASRNYIAFLRDHLGSMSQAGNNQ